MHRSRPPSHCHNAALEMNVLRSISGPCRATGPKSEQSICCWTSSFETDQSPLLFTPSWPPGALSSSHSPLPWHSLPRRKRRMQICNALLISLLCAADPVTGLGHRERNLKQRRPFVESWVGDQRSYKRPVVIDQGDIDMLAGPPPPAPEYDVEAEEEKIRMAQIAGVCMKLFTSSPFPFFTCFIPAPLLRVTAYQRLIYCCAEMFLGGHDGLRVLHYPVRAEGI